MARTTGVRVGLSDEARVEMRNFSEAINAKVRDVVERDAERTEGMLVKWLRENLHWSLRWAIGYPKALKLLSRLHIVKLPELVSSPAYEWGRGVLKRSICCNELVGTWHRDDCRALGGHHPGIVLPKDCAPSECTAAGCAFASPHHHVEDLDGGRIVWH